METLEEKAIYVDNMLYPGTSDVVQAMYDKIKKAVSSNDIQHSAQIENLLKAKKEYDRAWELSKDKMTEKAWKKHPRNVEGYDSAADFVNDIQEETLFLELLADKAYEQAKFERYELKHPRLATRLEMASYYLKLAAGVVWDKFD
ncbi:hypothetical protein H6503_04355 [Candidatus Woesearchaeota archaeon]|nr:hypothetical protein [Candidatus Woesearchaeota archaeon]